MPSDSDTGSPLPPPRIRIEAGFGNVTEGSGPGNGGMATFFLLREGDLSLPVVVTLRAGPVPGDDSPADASDLANGFLPFTLVMPAGATLVPVSVPIAPDLNDEDDEAFELRIIAAAGGEIARPDSAVVRIEDDDEPDPYVYVQPVHLEVPEGDNWSELLQFDLVREGNLAKPSVVTLSLEAGLSDHPAQSNDVEGGFRTFEVTIPAGLSTYRVSIPTVPDRVFEPDESVGLRITGAVGARVIEPSYAQSVILNDDRPPPEVWLDRSSVALLEGTGAASAGVARLLLQRSYAAIADTRVTLELAPIDGLHPADSDDLLASHPGPLNRFGLFTFTFTGFERIIPLDIVFSPDDVGEMNETMRLRIVNVENGVASDFTRTYITILNDDGPPSTVRVVAAEPEVQEGTGEGQGGVAVFRVLRSGDDSRATTVYLQSGPARGASPAADEDLEPGFRGYSVTLPSGVSEALVSIPIVPDDLDEPDEVFTLRITHALGSLIGSPRDAQVVIRDDDDPPPVFSIAAQRARVPEGTGAVAHETITFVISREGDLSRPATVTWARLAEAPMPLADAADLDGAAGQGSVFLPIGASAVLLTFTVTPDDLTESHEAVAVRLTGTSHGTIGPQNLSATQIIDDDEPPEINIAGESSFPPEGTGDTTEFDFRLFRTGNPMRDVIVVLEVVAGPGGVNAADFAERGEYAFLERLPEWQIDTGYRDGPVLRRFEVPMPGGTVERAVTIRINTDADFEGDEPFTVRIAEVRGGVIGPQSSATATILNDDHPPPLDETEPPRISIRPEPVVDSREGNPGWGGEVDFFVFRESGRRDVDVRVQVELRSGPGPHPANGADFLPFTWGGQELQPSGEGPVLLTFKIPIPAGQAMNYATIRFAPDKTFEPDETFSMRIAGVEGGEIGSQREASAVIVNDDERPARVSLAADAVTRPEGSPDTGVTAFELRVIREGNLREPVMAQVDFRPGGGGSPADPDDILSFRFDGRDFPAVNDDGLLQRFLIRFAPGETEHRVRVTLANDTVFEPNESFEARITRVENGETGSNPNLTFTILNEDRDETRVRLVTVDAGAVAEGTAPGRGGELVFDFERAGPLHDTSVAIIRIDGPGITPDDIARVVGASRFDDVWLLAFDVGEAQRRLTIEIAPDARPETDEDLLVHLVGATGALAIPGTGRGTIINDDDFSPRPTGGNDHLVSNGAPRDLRGGPGDDTLVGGGSVVSMHGGSGDDHLKAYTDGAKIRGGLGSNTALLIGHANEYRGGPDRDEVEAHGDSNVLRLGAGDNSVGVYGNSNVIATGHGNDVANIAGAQNFAVFGNGNNTVVVIGTLNTVSFGAGNNFVRAIGNENTANFKGGNNLITVEGSNNTIKAGVGANRISAKGDGNTFLLKGDDTYVWVEGTGNDVRVLDGSNEVIVFGDGNEVQAGRGNDTIVLYGNGNTAKGGARNDHMTAFGRNNTLDAGPGNDTLEGGSGNDTLIPGPGADLVAGGQDEGFLIGFPFVEGGDLGVNFVTGDLIDLRAPNGRGDRALDEVLYRVYELPDGTWVHDGFDEIVGFEPGLDRVFIKGAPGEVLPAYWPELLQVAAGTLLYFAGLPGAGMFFRNAFDLSVTPTEDGARIM